MAAYNFRDLVGQKFGHLTVVERVENYHRKYSRYLCRCDCGEIRLVLATSLRTGNTRSCGCVGRDRIVKQSTIHGLYGIPGYKTWQHMKARCLNSDTPNFADYGGRGITVCDRWLESFENFITDMGPRPGPEYSIERIDNDGPYTPDNCKWGNPIEQMNNQRSNHRLTFQGRTMTVAQWAREIGIRPLTLLYRIRSGWSVERALKTPVRR